MKTRAPLALEYTPGVTAVMVRETKADQRSPVTPFRREPGCAIWLFEPGDCGLGGLRNGLQFSEIGLLMIVEQLTQARQSLGRI